MAKKSKRGSALSIPKLSDVEGRTVIPEDDYKLKVVEVEDGEGDKAPYLKWTFEIAEGEYEGKKPKAYYTSFAPDALFNLRSVLEALGVEIPDDEFELDKDELIGLEVMGTIEHETYQGRKQMQIVDFSPVEEEKSSKKGDKKKGDDKKSAKGKKSKEPEKPDEDALGEMDEDELKQVIEDHELDVDPDDFPKVSKLRAAILKAFEDDGEPEEKDDKDKKKGDKDKKKGKAEKPDEDAINGMDQDELADVIKEHDIDVDLDDFKTLRKMRAAVVEALE